MDFQDQNPAPSKDSQQKVARNPNNANILKGGQVDPGSKLYQRSVAGRQKLEDYVRDLWDQGKDEKDVFMGAVKSLMSRGHGYVGAYLDSKDPGRRYTEPQAMKIADEVMKKAGIGSHPGARLTPAEGDEEKTARKEDRTQRREARKSGPAPAPAQKAKPVGQQRKEGKRAGSERVAEEDTRRAGIGKPAIGPVSEWQNTLESRLKGEASTQDVLSAFQKQYQSKIGGKKKTAQTQPQTEGQPPSGSAPAQPQPEKVAAPESETETPGKPLADDVTVSSKFKELIKGNIKNNLPSTDKNALEGSIQEAIEILEDEYDVDPEAARAAIFRRFNNKLIGGRKIVFDPSSAPEGPGQGKPAPETGQQEAAGPSPTQEPPTAPTSTPAPAPGPAQQGGASPVSSEEVLDDFLEAYGDYLMDPDDWSGSKTKKAINDYIKNTASDYGVKPQDIVSAIRSDERGGVILKRHGFGASSLVRKAPKQPTEPTPTPATPEASPGQQEAAAPTAPAPAPTARQPLPEERLSRGGRSGGNKPPGFTPAVGKQAKGNIRQAVSEGKTPQEVVNEFKQGNLFGGMGVETGSAATNPLEGGSTPTPTSPPEELAPSSGLAGATKPSESPGQKTFLSKAKGKETQILPSAIQVPKPGQGVTDAESYTKQLNDAGIPTDKINEAVKKRFGTKPRGKAKSKGSKTINSAEYQEFAQSVRSMMR